MGFLDDAKKKLGDAVDKHGDKINEGLDKAGKRHRRARPVASTATRSTPALAKTKDALENLDGKKRRPACLRRRQPAARAVPRLPRRTEHRPDRPDRPLRPGEPTEPTEPTAPAGPTSSTGGDPDPVPTDPSPVPPEPGADPNEDIAVGHPAGPVRRTAVSDPNLSERPSRTWTLPPTRAPAAPPT